MSPTALIVGAVFHAINRLERLQKLHSIEYCTSRSREEFIQDCSGKYRDVSVFYLSPQAHATVGYFDKELVEKLPQGLRFITYCGAGYESIDVHACAERRILVSHTPMAVDDATADVAALLILNCCRNVNQFSENIRAGRWNNGVSMGIDPEGKTLGILGMGGIGKTLAKRMAGFDMKVIYHNRRQLDLEDIISIHVPLSPETAHLIDHREFTMMKDGVILVNTARGKVINEQVLVRFLETGKVLAVGLDVFEEEPKIHPGLLAHSRSVLLPHIGTATNESRHKMESLVFDNLEAALTQGTLITHVPEHRNIL
ncbi:hypothetical protein DFQ28_008847 [Apophysomyces sp. BC1034]|nr:hypothetical protein DFQ30_005269 [Apophysomyces sp. BC1015]KAG0183356.1 hypothetical protein DFQ29_005731 [Apophysomyces sp. BC1021]KAG0194589.1 hypothetical protein DFQ28_008847 [Apophysomyces sp. BC1034]